MVSLLWKACQEGDSARVEELLADSSNDIDVKDHTGVTPLILAVKGGHSTIVQALLNRGADPNNASTQGRPETYTTDPYILHILAVARGDVAPYPEAAMHPQYYPYPPYYQYVQDSWYLHHHPQQPAQQEDHQPDPADSSSNTPPTANTTAGNPSMMSTNPSSHPSLPPPEIARNIPCRYFPACRYGSSCVFLHPTTPYFPGSLPPPAQYPHMYYPPLAFAPQGTAATAGSNTTSHDSNDTSAQAQQYSSDQNGVVENTPNAASVGAQSESGVSVSGEVPNENGTHGRVRSPSAGAPTPTSLYGHPAMVYMYPAMHPPPPPPHSQEGSSVHGHHSAPPPPPHHYPHYAPPPPPPPHPHSHSVAQPQSLPTHQHIIPPHENGMQPEQHQPPQPLPDVQGQPQPPTGPQVHPSHVMPYPQPPQIYPSPLHSTHAPWSHMPHPQPPPPPPHHHHPSHPHPGVHPHHHMHPTAPIPPPHPALTTIPPIPGMPVPGAVMPVPSGPGVVSPTSNGLGSFASRGGRGGRRGGGAFRGDRDRERERERNDRDRGDRDRDRFGTHQNGHYHHNGLHHSKKQLCLFFPNGKCRNGEDCRFSHVLPDPNGTVPNGNGSPLSPNAPLPGHRHSQSFSYRRSNYMNGHSLNHNHVNGDDETHQPSSIAGAGTGPSTNAGTAGVVTGAGAISSVTGVDEILNAMTLNTPDRRQTGGGGRRGKYQGQGGGGGGGYGHAHSYSHGGANSQSLSVSPSRGQQRVPTAADFPVLGNGSSTNGAGSSTATSATGRTTPVHPISSAASNAGGTTATSTPGSAVSPPVTAAAPTSSWSTGGSGRPTAAQVVKDGMSNGHGHLGAWGKPPPPSSATVEKEKVFREKEKEKDNDVKEKERAMVKEVKVSA